MFKEISRKLHSFVPNLVTVDVIDDKENNQYLIVLSDIDGNKYSSRVLSEGTLRILALCILWQDDKHRGLLCFEEPENGVHPSRIKTMASLLRDLSADFNDEERPLRQVIINTHSTVFIRQLRKQLADPCLSLHFARIVSRILKYDDKKTALLASAISPVSKETDPVLPFSEPDSRLTYQLLEEFLDNDVLGDDKSQR